MRQDSRRNEALREELRRNAPLGLSRFYVVRLPSEIILRYPSSGVLRLCSLATSLGSGLYIEVSQSYLKL